MRRKVLKPPRPPGQDFQPHLQMSLKLAVIILDPIPLEASGPRYIKPVPDRFRNRKAIL